MPPLLSLPGIFQTSLSTIPATVPYLHADEKLIEQWRRELSTIHGFKVGIVWHGNPDFINNPQRSIPLKHFAPLAKVAGVQLMSLQKGPGTEQLDAIAGQFSVMQFDDSLDVAAGGFMDTAAIMKNLDLMICSDTSVPHLAGALGVPVWVALPNAPDWRWLLEREDSPWYPTMRLFRQREAGDWDEVFQRIAQELQRTMESDS